MKDLCNVDIAITADPFFKECFMEGEREAFRQRSRGVTTDATVHYVDGGFQLLRFPVVCMSFMAQRTLWSRLHMDIISQSMLPTVTSPAHG